MVTKEQKNGKEIFVALDVNSIVHRAFHSFPDTLETTQGLQVNAAFGFTSMFLRVMELFDPKYIVCAFDTAKPTFRHTLFPEYKATRKPTDQSLIDQFPIVEDIVKSFNIPILKKEGYEADDIIGTLAKYVNDGKWSESNVHLCVISGDSDLLQLVGKNVSVVLPQGNFRNPKEFMREEVYEKFSVYPEHLVDYKALVGDSSDNIPGVKGVGSKTAVDLIQEYGCLDGIYSNISNLKPSIKKLLEEGAEQAGISKELATIFQDVDLKVGLEDCLEKDFDYSKVIEKFAELEFRSLINRVPESFDSKKEQENLENGQIGLFESNSQEKSKSFDSKELKQALESAQDMVVLFFDTNESSQKKASINLQIKKVGGEETRLVVYEDDFLEFLETVSQGKAKEIQGDIVFYGLEDFLPKVEAENLQILQFVEKVYEIKVLAHIDSSSGKDYSFSNLCFKYLSKHIPDPVDIAEIDKYFVYAKDICEKIKENLKGRAISFNLFKEEIDFLPFASKTENFLSVVLASMERRGILMDINLLKNLKNELEKDIKKLEQEIYYHVGHEFNINSTQQLADVLYNEIGLVPLKKTKTSYSTKESVLKQLEGAHPAISKILEYRKKNKVMSTYINAYESEMDSKTIHTDFKQTGTTSGRLSSANPNMQNLPVGDDLADRLRSIFIPRPNYIFVSADYSQIDLRVMAHLSEDEKLIEDFTEGRDVHLATASRILNKSQDDISATERRVGKTINFGIIYGLTPYGLSQSLEIPNDEAKRYIEEYFTHYSGVAKYIDVVGKDVQREGYVETILGRRRYVPGVNSRNVRVKNAAIREAINMPVQGGSADVMKIAMIDIYNLILEKYPKEVFMLLQIHDEIIFEVKYEVLEDFEKELKGIMEGIINLKVPLDVHISNGESLSELK